MVEMEMNSANANRGESPSYFDLLIAIREFVNKEYQEMFTEGKKPLTATAEWNTTPADLFYVALVTMILAALRNLATEYVFKPIGRRYSLTPPSLEKFPESAWRFLYFLCSWSCTCYVVLISRKYRFFQQPSTVFQGWTVKENPPGDIYSIYVLQCSFYIHFSYTTLFVDTWRKDSIAMFIHHVVSLVLIVLSHGWRLHKIGILVFFLFDICDVLMEFAKLNIYFKIQGKKLVRRHELLANAAFICFFTTWFVARLYWYPVKVLYAASYHSLKLEDIPHKFTFNCLLWAILLLNVYWTTYILQVLLRVITGNTQELEDIRDLDESKTSSKHLDSKNDCNTDKQYQNSFKRTLEKKGS